MKVLVIAANQEMKPDPVIPLGAVYVATAAQRAGHNVTFYDACFAGERAIDDIRKQCQLHKPDVVGLSIRNVDDIAWPKVTSYVEYYLEIIAVIRESTPKAILIVGGSAFTIFPDEFLAAMKPDFGVVGPGEESFVKLLEEVQELVRTKEDPRKGLKPTLISATYTSAHCDYLRPDFSFIDLKHYYRYSGAINLQTKRGCPYKCSYCTYPILEGRAVQPKETSQVVDHIAEMKADSGLDYFFIVDNTFNTPARHARAFCNELIGRNLGIRWTAYVTPAGLQEDVVELMAKSGCVSVDIGTESATLQTLKGLKKSFLPKDIIEASKWFKKYGIKFSHSLILGGPGETMNTLNTTRELINSTEPDAVTATLGVRLYRDTSITHDLVNEGWIQREEVGLNPVFYISPEVKDYIIEWADDTRNTYSNWWFPGLEGDSKVDLFSRIRSRGRKGPLWELMAR